MRTLIIPDIHNHFREAEEVISKIEYDQVLFLGDYFDSFYDTPSMAHETAVWLRESIEKEDRIHLWGNHDLPYRFLNNPHISCDGFSTGKAQVISRVLEREHWERLKFAHTIGSFLFCHAGIKWDARMYSRQNFSEAWLERECDTALEKAIQRESHHFYGMSGIVWARWYEIDVLDDWNQIVGHTPDPMLRVERNDGRFNVCLDTMGHYVGLLEGDAFHVVDTRTGQSEQIEP